MIRKTDTQSYTLYLTEKLAHSHTRYILMDSDGNLYCGTQMRSPEEIAQIPPADLVHLPRWRLNTEKYLPLLNAASVTVYNGPIDASTYVKKQALLNTGIHAQKPEWYKKMMIRELLMADELHKHPHPNICTYRGAIVHPVSRYVTGLAYKRYTLDLEQFVWQKKLVSASQIETLMDGLTAGMRHLHKLGIVHCDLRPPNVFLTLVPPVPTLEGGILIRPVIEEVVLGDFDAAVKVGEMIEGKLIHEEFRHPGYDFGKRAAFELDTFALIEVEKWLWEKLKARQELEVDKL